MDTKKAFQELIERAKKDPKFFHKLVFKPEEVLAELPNLNKKSRGKIVGANIEAVIATIAGLPWCGRTCFFTCAHTCGFTSLGGVVIPIEDQNQDKLKIKNESAYFSHMKGRIDYCGNTCDSSCGNTCDSSSCGHTCGAGSCQSTSGFGFGGFGGDIIR